MDPQSSQTWGLQGFNFPQEPLPPYTRLETIEDEHSCSGFSILGPRQPSSQYSIVSTSRRHQGHAQHIVTPLVLSFERPAGGNSICGGRSARRRLDGMMVT